MNHFGRGLDGGALHPLRVLITIIAVLALAPLAGLSQASAQETATIQVQSFGPDGATPLPFARFTVTGSDGATYGPLESTLDGTVTFTVDVGDDVTYTVEESVPPSCGITPDPQEVGPLAAGESDSVSFTTQFDDDCDRGSISAYKYTCPDGFDAASSYDAFVAECTEEVDGNPFRLSENGAEILTVQTGAYGIAGRAPVVDLTPGDYQLADLADGDDAADVAFCLTFPGNQAQGGGPSDVASAELNDGTVDVSTDDNRIACDFFVIPGDGGDQDEGEQDGDDGDQGDDGQGQDEQEEAQQQEQQEDDEDDGGQGQGQIDDVEAAQTGTGYVELHKAACPPGYDDGNYFEDCHGEGVEGVEFTIDGPNGYSDSTDTVILEDPGPGVVAFSDLEAGAYVINEDVPGDVTDTFIYCSMADSDEQVPFDETNQGGIALDLADGQAVICDWYNIPVQQFENARLEIVKHTCPDSFDAEGAFYAELLENCPDVTGGVTFTLTRQEDPNFERVKVTSGSGRVVYSDLVPGTYVLTEDVPAGVERIVLVCNVNDGSPYAKDVANGATSFGIDGSGQDVYCDWFNIPPFTEPEPEPAQTGYIELHKSACPPGYDDGNYFEDCHWNGVEGVEFTIDGPNGYSDSAETVLLDDPDEDPGPGVVAFSDLAAGTYVINEDVPGDVTETFVYCSMATSDEVVPFDYTDQGGIALDLADGQAVVCDWYNIPIPQFDPGTLEITKYTCPTGYNGNASYADYLDDCANPTEGVTFYVTGQGEIEPRIDTSGGNGVVSFNNLSPNTYQVSEDVPDEFAAPVAFCSVNGGEAFELNLGDGNGYLEFDDEGMAFSCDWFNIPADLRADAQVTIQKRLCPAGYGGANYAQDCDDPVQSVTFNADGPQGYDENATTGPQGIAFFENLAAGNYVLTELPPDNINVAVYVVGCFDNKGNVGFTYDDSTGLRIILPVKAGQEVTCNWYNIPPTQGPSGSITIHKFLCQGKADNNYNWEQECDNYGSGAEFELQTTGGEAIVRRTTNLEGLVTFANLADGAYGLDETTGNWCHAEADRVDAQGNVLVQNGGNTDVFIYNCGKKTIGTLPNTGVGPAPGTAGHAALWSVAGGLGGLMLLFVVRRRRAIPAAA